jgi:ATP-dependent Lhr-like helicase
MSRRPQVSPHPRARRSPADERQGDLFREARQDEPAALLPEPFARWFASRGWAPRAHQLELLKRAGAGRSMLLIAPTGGGKTLAGFLPTLVELSAASHVAQRAPSPLVGEGGGGGSGLLRETHPPTTTPTPILSPQGGG